MTKGYAMPSLPDRDWEEPATHVVHGVGKELGGFKKFLLRGNVVDLAVGIVIGAAFGNIVQALVRGVITPLICMAGGMPNLASWVIPCWKGPPAHWRGPECRHRVCADRRCGLLLGRTAGQQADGPVSPCAPAGADQGLSGMPQFDSAGRTSLSVVRGAIGATLG
jgi:hypothetical protein